MSPKLKNKIHKHWKKSFKELERLNTHQIRQYFEPREMVGLYAVAAICYDEGNHKPVIGDVIFDRLCQSIDEHFDECVKAGANLLDRRLVQCHSGFDTGTFVRPYHNIAEVLLGHPCRCFACMN